MALGPQGEHRAAQQRGHGAARGGRGAGGHGARERPALSAAPRQGRRARSDARVQREHPRVAERRPRRRQPRRSGRPLEPASRGAVRLAPRGGRRPPRSTRSWTTGSSRCCAARGETLRTARRSTACRSRRGTQPPRQRARQRRDDAAARRRRAPSPARSSIIEDISARVQLEEQLQISEKMASIGLLAAGVAHEVNTPLTGISSFVQMLMEGAEPDDPKTKVLEKIEKQTFRAARIVNGLLNLARPAQVDSGPVDINAVINDVLSLLDHQMRTGRIQVRKELAASGPIVQGTEYKLQQVFLNLFLNARDAMPKGGLADDRDAGRRRQRDDRNRATPARAFRPISCRASTIPSSRRRRSARARASGCRSPTASCRSTAVRSPATAHPGRAPGSACRCRWRRPASQRARAESSPVIPVALCSPAARAQDL